MTSSTSVYPPQPGPIIGSDPFSGPHDTPTAPEVDLFDSSLPYPVPYPPVDAPQASRAPPREVLRTVTANVSTAEPELRVMVSDPQTVERAFVTVPGVILDSHASTGTTCTHFKIHLHHFQQASRNPWTLRLKLRLKPQIQERMADGLCCCHMALCGDVVPSLMWNQDDLIHAEAHVSAALNCSQK
jgi:hypothetical protein